MDILLLVFILSLLIGSFYNVLIIRTFNREDIILGSSHCMNCNKKLNIFDMIPVLSFVLLNGRCRYCDKQISPIYIIGEILTGISYSIVYYIFGFTVNGFLNFIFISIMILSSISDIYDGTVSNSIIFSGIIMVFTYRVLLDLNPIRYIIYGALSFFVLYIIYRLSNNGIGGADVKIYGLIGLSIGFFESLNTLFYASLIALIFTFIRYIIYGEKILKDNIKFIPFILLGILVLFIMDSY